MYNIKKNLKKRGIKLTDVANALGISLSALTQSLNSDMSASRLVAIAEYCKCTVDGLVHDGQGDDAPSADTTLTCPHCGKEIKIKAG